MRILDRDLSDTVLLVPALGFVAILGIFGSRLLNQVRSSVVFISLYCLFGLLGLVLYWRYQDARPGSIVDVETPSSTAIRLGLSILFFVTFAAAVLALETRSPGAVRPVSYYVFVSLAIGVLALRSLVSTGSRRDIAWVLAQILVLGLLIRFALVYLNPYPYVSDTQFHWYITTQTLSSGLFQGRGPYEFYPVFHLFNAAFYLLSVDGQIAAWLFPTINTLVVTSTIVVFFYLGRLTYGYRAGLLAAVILLTENFYFLGAQYKTNWMGVTFFLLAVGLLLKLLSTRDIRLWIVFWITALAALLVHPVVFISLILATTGIYLTLQEGEWAKITRNSVPVASLVTVFMTYILYLHRKLFVDLVDATIGIEGATGSERLGLTTNIGQVPLVSPFTAELLVNFIGPTMFVMLVVPGSLYCLRNRDKVSNAMALSTALIYVFILVVLLTGRGGSLSITRALPYVSPLSVVVAAIGLEHMIPSLPSRKIKAMLFAFFVLTALFSSISYLNNYNGVYTDDVKHFQLTAKPSMLASNSFLEKTPNGSRIAGDKFNTQYVASPNPVRGMHVLESEEYAVRFFYTPNWTRSDYFIIDSGALNIYNSFIGPSYDGLDNRMNGSMSKVYANTGVAIYYRTNQSTFAPAQG